MLDGFDLNHFEGIEQLNEYLERKGKDKFRLGGGSTNHVFKRSIELSRLKNRYDSYRIVIELFREPMNTKLLRSFSFYSEKYKYDSSLNDY
jgi:hypothetical protein